jgi:hypothetical protein
MSKPPSKAEDFLRAMSPDVAERPPSIPRDEPAPTTAARPASRTGLKHIGGYFDKETVEKVAVLRARLDLDNSGLIKLAIEELHRKHAAKRSFGES